MQIKIDNFVIPNDITSNNILTTYVHRFKETV
jgi:hypothetical protein